MNNDELHTKFIPALEAFLKEWQEKRERYFYKRGFFKSIDTDKLYYEFGRKNKYAKVFAEHSIYAFIETSTGDIYKPSNCYTPAKHVRGNIYNNPMNCTGPYGINYLTSHGGVSW